MKIQQNNSAIEPYDVLTHLDVLTEEENTPVAEMLMSSCNPGLFVEQEYVYEGVEKDHYESSPENIRQPLPGE